MTPEELLSNDIALWDMNTTRLRNADGTVKATLKDGCYPLGWDGGDITGRVADAAPRHQVGMWHSFVKGKIDAWQASKETQALERADSHARDSVGKDGAAERSEGSSQAAAGNLPSGEVSLEDLLKSKVASLRGHVASVEREIEGASNRLDGLRTNRARVKRELRSTMKAARAAGVVLPEEENL